MNQINAPDQTRPNSFDSVRSHVEGYPQGGRIERHSHDWDQLALITHSAAIVETESCYLVHPLLKAIWLPAGVEHSVYSPRPFYLHSLYFLANSVRAEKEPQILGLDNLARELILFLCTVPRQSQRLTRHSHAFMLLAELLPEAKPETFTLPRPQSERARKLADYLALNPQDARSLEVLVEHVGGASLRTFERLFLDETRVSLAVWRRQSCMLAALSLLAEGKSISVAAGAVGYQSIAAFSTAFKQCFGQSPSRYFSV